MVVRDDIDEFRSKLKGGDCSFLLSFLSNGSLEPIYYFEGTIKDVTVQVIAGIHGSEPSGIEIANWLRVKLDALDVSMINTVLPAPQLASLTAKTSGLGDEPSRQTTTQTVPLHQLTPSAIPQGPKAEGVSPTGYGFAKSRGRECERNQPQLSSIWQFCAWRWPNALG